MPYAELSSFVKGRKTRRGEPTGIEPEVVTVVYAAPGETLDQAACRFFGCRPAELRPILRALRDGGRLVHNVGRLRQTVRFDDGAGGLVRRQAVVVRGLAEEAPRKRRLRAFTA